ncbi:alpha/beta fold hydrolase [Azospirillum sp.]|uniref:alpha/beta fold hydrolase n=1 Tax=Azospirillum sp. TaxID=34012 RepID=UPI003D756EEA
MTACVCTSNWPAQTAPRPSCCCTAFAALDLCDDGRLVRFERATHWLQHEEAERVNRELIAFLRGG